MGRWIDPLWWTHWAISHPSHDLGMCYPVCRMVRAQLGTISVGLDSLSTCTKVCRIGCRAKLGTILVNPGSQSTFTKVCTIGCMAKLGTILVNPGSQSTFTKICRIGCRAKLGTILVSPGSQSTFTKVCIIGCKAQLGANWNRQNMHEVKGQLKGILTIEMIHVP